MLISTQHIFLLPQNLKSKKILFNFFIDYKYNINFFSFQIINTLFFKNLIFFYKSFILGFTQLMIFEKTFDLRKRYLESQFDLEKISISWQFIFSHIFKQISYKNISIIVNEFESDILVFKPWLSTYEILSFIKKDFNLYSFSTYFFFYNFLIYMTNDNLAYFLKKYIILKLNLKTFYFYNSFNFSFYSKLV